MSDGQKQVKREIRAGSRPNAGVRAETAVESQARAIQPHPVWGPYVLWLFVVGIVACIGAVWFRTRTASLRTWSQFAREVGAEFAAKNHVSPAYVSGQFKERDFMLVTSTGFDDDAPFYHTRARMPVINRSGIVLGLRRKSFLEEGQTRRTEPEFFPEDPEFERLFFIVANDAEGLPAVLSPEVRRELKRYPDIEIYIHLAEIEWRRPGEENDLARLRRLVNLLHGMAASLDGLPSSKRGLSQRLADQELIAKGV